MRLNTIKINNYRRLRNVTIDVADDTTVFVGANNSGKTSATQIFRTFFGHGSRFSIYDFSADCWDKFDNIAGDPARVDELPFITLDLWFKVDARDLGKIYPILPDLKWRDAPLGVRLKYAPRSPIEMLQKFNDLRQKALATITKEFESSTEDHVEYKPWPNSLTDYLRKELYKDYRIEYLSIERQGESYSDPIEGLPLGGSTEAGKRILSSLLRVDFLDAQRYLSDQESGGRSQSLSSKLGSFYRRNLEQHELDITARNTLAKSEKEFDRHLDKVFESTLASLNNLGYPGFLEPRLSLKSDLDSDGLVARSANIHYGMTSTSTNIERTLPDRYSGLGFKNLIYMVVELLDFHERWKTDEERAALHVILIEEPEVHLHVQLQQVFIGKVHEVLRERSPSLPEPQLLVTTHSPHIIYEGDYSKVRYFKRVGRSTSAQSSTEVVSPATASIPEVDKTFLEKYFKLTHCDLFFADAAILIEGNSERLLMPLMIKKCAPDLASRYISTLEVGGAFASRFAHLIDLLGIPMLVITDLDSVVTKGGKACPTSTPNAVTSNPALIQWLKEASIDGLLDLAEAQKVAPSIEGSDTYVRLAYQSRTDVEWGTNSQKLVGRTFEEEVVLHNLQWAAEAPNASYLGFFKDGELSPTTHTLDQVAGATYDRVRADSFKKTDFAVALLTVSTPWDAPQYIADGLKWLASVMVDSTSANGAGIPDDK